MNLGIASRVRWLVLAPLAGLGLISVVAVSLLSGRDLSARVDKDSETAASSLSSFIKAELDHLQMETKLLAEVPYFKSAVFIQDTGAQGSLFDRNTVQEQFGRYSSFLNGDGLLLIDADGNVIAGVGPLANRVGHPTTSFGFAKGMDAQSWSGIESQPEGMVMAAESPLTVGGYPKGVLVSYTMVSSGVARKLANQMGVGVAFAQGGRLVASSMNGTVPVASTGTSRLNADGKEYVGKWAPLPNTNPGQRISFIALRSTDDIVGASQLLLKAMLGIIALSALAAALLARRFGEDLTEPLEEVVAAAKELEDGVWPDPIRVSRVGELAVLQSAFNGMTASVRDQQERLKAMAYLDPLTELPNHRKFKEDLGHTIVEEHARSRSLVLVIADIDRFGAFNRRHGLADGEEVILSLARIAKRLAPETATMARYGGDELALLLPGATTLAAKSLAEEIRGAFAASVGQGELTLSVGIAHVTPTTDRAESLALAAELALAKAKQLGRNQICEFESLVGPQGSDPYELHRFLEDATVSTVQALAAAVDAKDSYTRGHSQRVAQYAADLCRFVGGSEAEVELVFRTGTLHDIGKIGIPDEILKKAGPLTPEERATMETHPGVGELIVRKVPHLQDTLTGVRHHHERWDGMGYPDQLSGQDIPRLARLLAIADTYDAMTSDRPYRKGLAISVALAEIEKNAGIQFDPDLALAFVRLMNVEVDLPMAA